MTLGGGFFLQTIFSYERGDTTRKLSVQSVRVFGTKSALNNKKHTGMKANKLSPLLWLNVKHLHISRNLTKNALDFSKSLGKVVFRDNYCPFRGYCVAPPPQIDVRASVRPSVSVCLCLADVTLRSTSNDIGQSLANHHLNHRLIII